MKALLWKETELHCDSPPSSLPGLINFTALHRLVPRTCSYTSNYLLKIRFKPRATVRGPSGLVIWSAATFAVCIGFYRIGMTNYARKLEKKEIREARFAIAPMLQVSDSNLCANCRTLTE